MESRGTQTRDLPTSPDKDVMARMRICAAMETAGGRIRHKRSHENGRPSGGENRNTPGQEGSDEDDDDIGRLRGDRVEEGMD